MIDVVSERLVLRLVPMAGLAATVAHDLPACRRLIGASLDETWFGESWVANLRLQQWKDDPAYAPWSIRAVALRDGGTIVGYMNAHDHPRNMTQDGITASFVEIGYGIFRPWRRQGIATEVVRSFGTFAERKGVRWLRLSISPDNAASLGLARKLGARKIGSQIDEIDGPEDVYIIDL